MELDEAKKVLEDKGYVVEATHYDHDSRVDLSKLETKLKEMEQDIGIFNRIGAMVVAYFDREYGCEASCKANEDDAEHIWYIRIKTDPDIRSAMIFEISISDYNTKELWIEYDIFGKEGGRPAKYSDGKYADLMKDENSYLSVIANLVKGEE